MLLQTTTVTCFYTGWYISCRYNKIQSSISTVYLPHNSMNSMFSALDRFLYPKICLSLHFIEWPLGAGSKYEWISPRGNITCKGAEFTFIRGFANTSFSPMPSFSCYSRSGRDHHSSTRPPLVSNDLFVAELTEKWSGISCEVQLVDIPPSFVLIFVLNRSLPSGLEFSQSLQNQKSTWHAQATNAGGNDRFRPVLPPSGYYSPPC